MTAVVFKVKGLDKAASNMKKRSGKIKKGRRGMIMAVLTQVDQVTKRNFDTSGMANDPPRHWKRLAPSTLKFKMKHRRSSQPLIFTGNLKRMWHLRATSRLGTYTSQATTNKGVPYGALHQEGIGVPKRPFLPVAKQVAKISKKIIGVALKSSIHFRI